MDVKAVMQEIGQKAKAASSELAFATPAAKRTALEAAADCIESSIAEIITANEKDMDFGREKGLSNAMLDRLMLDEARVQDIAEGLRTVAAQDDPVGKVLAEWDMPSGLNIKRVSTPLGVIGVIYESRPNVTADAGGLCLKAGNAAILRGGSESFHSSSAIHACLVQGLKAAGLPADAIQLVPTRDRAAVSEMLTMTDYIDASADPEKARAIVMNAKTRRTGICGSAETVLIDKAFFAKHAAPFIDDMVKAGVEVRADGVLAELEGTVKAKAEDFGVEYLDMIIAAKLVDGVDDAIKHIGIFGSNHTDAIVVEDDATAERFFARVDSAILMRNASTQFADGGEFGMGAEIGIATGKMHARGPVGAAQLTSFKVTGNGTIRP